PIDAGRDPGQLFRIRRGRDPVNVISLAAKAQRAQRFIGFILLSFSLRPSRLCGRKSYKRKPGDAGFIKKLLRK
ncbi:MAG: hypothetical protein NUV34_10220, partial [Sulfuricaulis sp.]|nr:hypothetical protein [Sulfuricaulis sp.]